MLLSIIINCLLVIHVIVALLLILVVLMQRPKNEGLGAAFGGGMTDNLFGAQTTNVLQTFTRNLGIVFFILAITLSVLYAKQSGMTSEVDRKLKDSAVPAAAAGESPAAVLPDSAAPVETPETTTTTVPGAMGTEKADDASETTDATVDEPTPAPEAAPAENEVKAGESPAAVAPEVTPIGDGQ